MYAGGAIIERAAVQSKPWVPKHEIGHLHNVQHPDRAEFSVGFYVSASPVEERWIYSERCDFMMKYSPEHYSPWFVAVGGTVAKSAANCPQ